MEAKSRRVWKYEEMSPKEFLEQVNAMPVFFVPAGLLEWHAEHLPLGLDALKARGICERAAAELGGGIILPPTYFGRPGFSSYVGTLTFSEACVDLLFTELFAELKKVGARVIVLITGHYGRCQVDCIKRVADYFHQANPEIELVAQPEYEGVEVDGETPADHAGKWETSLLWSLRPDLVRMEDFQMIPERKKLYPNPPNEFYHESEEWTWPDDLRRTASKERGDRALAVITTAIVERINEALDRLGLG